MDDPEQMNEEILRKKLRRFVMSYLIRNPNYDLGESEALITGGLIDSFGLAEIALFVEREFGVHIPSEELTSEKMNTLEQMVAYVMRGESSH